LKKVIVVGAGHWGKNLVKNFYDLGALAGVAEAHDGLRQVAQEQFSCPTYKDFLEALPNADALVIATPASTHYPFAKTALEAGKDVFIEKPMTLTTADAKELAELADANKRILMVGHLLLYQPAIAWIRDYLQSGKAGQVWHVSTQRAKLGKVRKQENVWWSFAPHDISVILELLGRPKLQTIKAQGQAMLQQGIQDDVHVSLHFEGNKTAHIHSSWYWPQNERSTTILAEKKMIVYNEVTQTVIVYDKGINPDLTERDQGSFVADVASGQPLRLECEHFLQCLETRERPRSDGWNGVAVVDILEKAQDAMKTRSAA
jgi:predicted dehydrogenase